MGLLVFKNVIFSILSGIIMPSIRCKRLHVLLILFFIPLSSLVAQIKYDLRQQLYPPFVQHEQLRPEFNWPNNQPAQKDSNVTLLGRWAWGHCYAVAARDNYAYIGNGGAFQVLDVSNPATPKLIAEITLFDLILDITLAGNFAYVADWTAGMRIIDISQPTKPVEVGFFKKGRIHNVAVAGNRAYVVNMEDNLLIVDVSSPANPVQLGSFAEPAYLAFDVAVAGNYAYLVGDVVALGRMVVVDVSNPANPIRVKPVGLDGSGTSAIVSDNKLYVTSAGGYVGGGGLLIADISIPTEPKPVGGHRADAPVWDVVLSGQHAYLMEGEVGVEVFDLSSSAVVGRFDTKFFAVDGAMTGNSLCVADFVGLDAIDISVPISPKLAGEFDTGYFAQAVAVSGNYAYVADGLAGLGVVNISNPAAIVTVGQVNTFGYAVDIITARNYAFIAEGTTGIQVFDISVPMNPLEVIHLPLAGSATGLTLFENYLFVASWDAGLHIIDISSPTRPIIAGSIKTKVAAVDVAVSGKYAYVADESGGLRIIDIATPSSLKEVSAFSPNGFVTSINVHSNYAYAIFTSQMGERKLLVLDISNPTNAQLISSYPLINGTDVALSGNYAYIIASPFQVLDVSDPSNPKRRGFFSPKGSAAAYHTLGFNNILRATVIDKNIYMPFGHNGFYILQNDLITSVVDNESDRDQPRSFLLRQNHPNPFKSYTIIAYDLPVTTRVTFEIYNLLGQLMRTLVDEIQMAGQHQITWNGRDDHGQQLPNGLYLYQLSAGQFRAIQKMLYIR